MKPAAIAADINLLRHPTPRRYITVIEALRDRPVVVLPSVNAELHRHLPIQAGEFIDSMARRKGVRDRTKLQATRTAGAAAALEWWRTERERNDTVYAHAHDLGLEHYGIIAAGLPSEAFTDDNDSDQWIYAEAIAHQIDVLASRNRNTILTEVLEEHFAAHGQPSPPVAVRSLWDHTTALAKAEQRPIEQVAFETMLCAIVPDAWSGSAQDAIALKWSAQRFIENLRTQTRPKNSPDPEREKLAHVLHRTLKPITQDQLTARGNAAYAILPHSARETERRYHSTTRAAIRKTGVDLWDS